MGLSSSWRLHSKGIHRGGSMEYEAKTSWEATMVRIWGASCHGLTIDALQETIVFSMSPCIIRKKD